MLGKIALVLKHLGIAYILYLDYVNKINLPILAIVLIALGALGMCKVGSSKKDPLFDYVFKFNAILVAFCAVLIFKHVKSMN